MVRSIGVTLGAAALLLASCGSGSNGGPSNMLPSELTDTTGEKFTPASPDAGVWSQLTPERADLVPVSCQSGSGQDVFVALPTHNVVVIEAVRLTDSGTQINGQPVLTFTDPSQSMRPIRCSNSSQCPMSVCTNRICRNPSVPMSGMDVMALCLADLPWPADCTSASTGVYGTRMVEAVAACPSGNACTTVPTDCLQP
jgi:hypothetical protein